MNMKWLCIILILLGACSGNRQIADQIEGMPAVYPDYTNVTIPYNISPLNFSLQSADGPAYAIFACGNTQFEVEAVNKEFVVPEKKWKELLSRAKGASIEITVVKKMQEQWNAYTPFVMHVAEEPIDSYLAYRLIEPGYALWNEMGIYQRNLETFEESAIYENKITNYNCVNCHSFCMQNPDQMLFHLRAKMSGTVLIDGEKLDFLDTKTDQTVSALTYPSWHPSGRYIAFSVNRTTQGIHPSQRVEVYDLASDVVVYDTDKQIILSTPLIFSKNNFETFPTFSPDGCTLYYCTAPSCPMPDSISQLKYSLCSISFDPELGTFGDKADTLYNGFLNDRSVSFPRVSPDGNYLLCTISGYATFPIWHKDADLYMIDLRKGRGHFPEEANSDEAESYHSWSSNSRWIIFSSRRFDGLYTHPFIAYVDKNGKVAKPFLLPQRHADYYATLMKSYNIPEFIKSKVTNHSFQIRLKAERGGQSVRFEMR